MVIVKGKINSFWHEKQLIVLILNKGSLPKNELFRKIRQEQKKRTVLGEKGIVHLKSAYEYWLKSRKNQWVVNECGDVLELTPLGKWIANSQLGTFFDRDSFVESMCPKCTKPGDLVLLKPLPDTTETNAKGRLFMSVKCPRCGCVIERWGISEVLSKGEFMDFYRKVVTELQKLRARGVKFVCE